MAIGRGRPQLQLHQVLSMGPKETRFNLSKTPTERKART